MQIPVTKIDFHKSVHQGWTLEQFLRRYSPVYPDADLEAYAKELGLVTEPAAEDNPAPATTLVIVPSISAKTNTEGDE